MDEAVRGRLRRKYAMHYTPAQDLPKSFVPADNTSATQRAKLESFERRERAWDAAISEIIDAVGEARADRIVSLRPGVPRGSTKVTDCEDFLELIAVLQTYRDQAATREGEEGSVIGCLASLADLLQRRIEDHLAA